MTASDSSIRAAISVAEQLPGESGGELRRIARDAFAQAFGTTAGISAAIAIGVALHAVALLRRRHSPA
jgi:hypothetical protein